MRRVILLAILAIATQNLFGQNVEETYPTEYWCPNDTFILKFKDYPKLFYYTASRKDKGSPGTDANLDEYFILYYGQDSIKVNYHNKLPYAHVIYFNFASPKGKTTFRFHYNPVPSYFPGSYMEKNRGNIQFDLPEVYELANIIWTLSPSGQRATDLYNTGEYYNKVRAYFKPYLDHPIFRSLDFPDSLYSLMYYEFRENSFAFNFKEPNKEDVTQLLFNGPYYYVFGDELSDSSLFGKLKPMVEDFAKKSRFRSFYKKNRDYYSKLISREKELLPIRPMWTWLEDQFPNNKYQSYRIVFSSLIGGSHSTQQYSTYSDNEWFKENVMFICGTARYDSMPELTEKQKEGLMSGVVFTEIDHNYVNPVSNKYVRSIDSIFSERNGWVRRDNFNDLYERPVSVFNEYMTHAAFCLYIADSYDKPTADLVIDRRVKMMVERRSFIKFKEFNDELIRLHQQYKDMKLQQLYPLILDWCRKQG
jgi:hypothetical protein